MLSPATLSPATLSPATLHHANVENNQCSTVRETPDAHCKPTPYRGCARPRDNPGCSRRSRAWRSDAIAWHLAERGQSHRARLEHDRPALGAGPHRGAQRSRAGISPFRLLLNQFNETLTFTTVALPELEMSGLRGISGGSLRIVIRLLADGYSRREIILPVEFTEDPSVPPPVNTPGVALTNGRPQVQKA